ncbi:MAG: hypothetical protein ACR2LK_07065 [Solirubrobacteraceae bacterium]
MALLTISEAAIKSGFSIELVESLTKKCPRPGETRLLQAAALDGTLYVTDAELDSYLVYLRMPWPRPSGGGRPHIPEAIARDVRAECHQSCAICGDMNSGELAHMDAVADTLNNSPDNLLFLCPNHHTEYDYGHKVRSNVSRDVVLAAKRMKRESRRRTLKFEGNVAAMLRSVIQAVRSIESSAKAEPNADLRDTYVTELQALLEALPQLSHAAQDAASTDDDFASDEAALVAVAPKLLALTQGVSTIPANPRAAAQGVVAATQDLINLDEVDCPHCLRRGTTGLIGDLCAYCGGSQVVSSATAETYDRDAIDEVDCPHCNGHGTTGLMNDVCAYCGGSQVVSSATAETYDRDAIDEVDCPHCNGHGTTGLVSDPCGVCSARTVVTRAVADAYARQFGDVHEY